MTDTEEPKRDEESLQEKLRRISKERKKLLITLRAFIESLEALEEFLK